MADVSMQMRMYEENRATLAERYEGMIIAVANGVFHGAYEDELTAYREMKARGFADGAFVVVTCERKEKPVSCPSCWPV